MLKRHVCVTAAIVLLVAASAGARYGADRAESVALDRNPLIERTIAPGEEHRYRLPVAPGERALVVVEQKAIDVVVRVEDSSGRTTAEFQDDLLRDGSERVGVVGGTDGLVTFAIAPAEGTVDTGAYVVRVAERRPATLADAMLQESRSLRTAALRLEREGRYMEARTDLERALKLAAGQLARDDRYLARLSSDLADNAAEVRDDGRARSFYERAAEGFDAALGPDNLYSAIVRSHLAVLLRRAGQQPAADAMLHAAMRTIERTLGREHPAYVNCLATLGTLQDDARDFAQAEEIDRAALATLDRIHQTGTLLDAVLLNNLGEILREKSEFAVAEVLFRRSMAIGEQLQGPDSYFISTTLQNLGVVARERKDYPSAAAYYVRALGIRERIVGLEHPDIAQLLNNLANVYRAIGADTMALQTHLRALHIWEKRAGPYRQGTLVSVGNIARTYAAMGDIKNAIAFQRRADAILETRLALNLATGSERQKLAFLRSVSERTDRTISLHLDRAHGDPGAASLAALVILQRKGRVQDAMRDIFAAARERVTDPGDRSLMDRLNDTTTELARVALDESEHSETDPHASLEALLARKEQLEAALSERSAELRSQIRPVTLEAVQASLPDDAALVEFAVFRPFDPKAERNAEAYAPPHYAAYVIRAGGPPVGVDLGGAADIDGLIDRLRDALRDPSVLDVSARARALDDRLLQPLRPSLAGARRLIISPDGALNLIPFEALVGDDGRYLVERYATSYVTSGRDLLRMDGPRGPAGPPLIVADPLFGDPSSRDAQTMTTASRGMTKAGEESRLYFAPLYGSAAEGRAIRALFPDAVLLTGTHATKASVEQARAPRILHIASHGFFLADERRPGVDLNPLLRSGIALAGANRASLAHGDGVLTALEASGLNLWGTKLVTLSACDTGVGDVRDGEGVYGLRRAFVLAGAESLVMSLWPVSDSIARDAMVAYYTRLRNGAGRADALRQAKLAILKQADRRHPYYWAGFILSGEWAPLE